MSSASEAWRRDALCAQAPADPRWWDSTLEGESDAARAERHAYAIRICSRCPVRRQCRKTAVPRVDEGIRGGVLMPAVRQASPKRRPRKTTAGREYKRLLEEGVSADIARVLAPVGARHWNALVLVRGAVPESRRRAS